MSLGARSGPRAAAAPRSASPARPAEADKQIAVSMSCGSCLLEPYHFWVYIKAMYFWKFPNDTEGHPEKGLCALATFLCTLREALCKAWGVCIIIFGRRIDTLSE